MKLFDTTRRGALYMPLPASDEELEILTELYFGKSLHLSKLFLYDRGASYEVKEPYNAYHGAGFTYSEHSSAGYDHSRRFWRTVIGSLTCGGIAGHSYGQTTVTGYRHQKRLRTWIDRRRRKQRCNLRTPFERLAAQLREQREQGHGT